MTPFIIHVPAPPSLNKLWRPATKKTKAGRSYQGRVKTDAYKAWLTEAGWEVKRQTAGMAMVTCRYDMEIQVPISRRDTGNWEKAISDLLESVGIVSNDGNVNELKVRPMDRTDCAVSIVPLPDMGAVRKTAKAQGLRTYRTVPRAASARSKKLAADNPWVKP